MLAQIFAWLVIQPGVLAAFKKKLAFDLGEFLLRTRIVLVQTLVAQLVIDVKFAVHGKREMAGTIPRRDVLLGAYHLRWRYWRRTANSHLVSLKVDVTAVAGIKRCQTIHVAQRVDTVSKDASTQRGNLDCAHKST